MLDAQGKPRDVMLIRRTMPQLEEFEKYNIAFDLMIAPYTPNCLLKKHPEWEGAFFGLGTESEAENLKRQTEEWKGRQAGHGFLKASVIAPDYREMCRTFLEYLLAFVRNSRMLVAIDLANEVQLEDYSPLMQQYFRDWLRRKYGSAEKLNAAWRSNYASIDDVLMVRPLVFDRTHPVRFWDWVLCNREAGTGHFRFLHELCRRNAPGVPTHVKHLPHEFGTPWYEMGSNARNFYDYADGIDRKALAGLTEIIGTDSWADNAHDESGRLSSDVPMQSAYFSLLRSYQPEKWIFDSEWHILRCDPPATPPACLDMVMQQNAVHGLRAGTFWLVCPGNGQHLELEQHRAADAAERAYRGEDPQQTRIFQCARVPSPPLRRALQPEIALCRRRPAFAAAAPVFRGGDVLRRGTAHRRRTAADRRRSHRPRPRSLGGARYAAADGGDAPRRCVNSRRTAAN